MRDIETREDIEQLMKAFYQKALNDEIIGYIFSDIAKLDLDKHIPIITDFWEMILLGQGNFMEKHGRSPMQSHIVLNEKEPLKFEHFKRWLKLFYETIEEHFAGETSNLAKIRARMIADTMEKRFSFEQKSLEKFVEALPR
jgi:hemoglobin